MDTTLELDSCPYENKLVVRNNPIRNCDRRTLRAAGRQVQKIDTCATLTRVPAAVTQHTSIFWGSYVQDRHYERPIVPKSGTDDEC
jgi:hypothetical protein